MEYYIYLIAFIVLILLRFMMNINKYFYLKKVIHQQKIFFEGKVTDANDSQKENSKKAANWISENQIEIRKVVINTGVGDQITSYMEPVGLGHAQQQSISALDNLAFLNIEIMKTGREIVNRAKGQYRIQAMKSFNPIFWIEFILFLPKEILKYLGVDNTAKVGSLITKIFQIIYWIASLFFMYQKYKSGNP
jgi:hypothetical protein